MKRNPIYQAILTSGVLAKMVQRFRHHDSLVRVKATYELDIGALRGMRDRGVMTFEEYYAIRARASRPFHAAVLKLARAEQPLLQRRRATMTLRRACPPGITARDFRIGRHAQA